MRSFYRLYLIAPILTVPPSCAQVTENFRHEACRQSMADLAPCTT